MQVFPHTLRIHSTPELEIQGLFDDNFVKDNKLVCMKVQRAIVVTLMLAWALALMSHFKVLHQSFFLCNGQNTVRRVILYKDKSCFSYVFINNVCCDLLLELPWHDGSMKGSQHAFMEN